MANRLEMAKVYAIQVLLERGWSQRRVAAALGVDRETVRRYARLALQATGPPEAPRDGELTPLVEGIVAWGSPKPATAPPGSAAEKTSIYDSAAEANPATEAPPGSDAADRAPPGSEAVASADRAPPGSEDGDHAAVSISQSQCEPYREIVLAKLEQGLSGKRIHQDLVVEHGFTAQYHSVRRFVQRLHGARPLPFRRMECEPGAEAQIDFGRGAPVVRPDGQRRRPHVLRVILSHSRKGYSEVVERQTTEDFIRALENAFHHFGGVPKTLVIDNLKAAVTKADWFDPDLNPKIVAFCRHYGTAILPTRPRTPRHKGKVEAGVKFVQENGLKGHVFASLSEQNTHLLHWETTVADTRIHGTTRRQVGKIFAEVERAALLPLPVERFPCFREAQRTVHRDGHVEVGKAYYSVPPEYLGRKVWVRWDGHFVRIFDQRLTQITAHAQREPGRFATEPEHITSKKIAGVERGSAWWLRKAHRIGHHTGRWAEDMLGQRGIPGVRVLIGLVGLTHKHADTAIEQACRVAHSHAAYRLRDVRNLLKRQAPEQEQFDFIQEHPLIRSLADYGQLVHNAFEEIHS